MKRMKNIDALRGISIIWVVGFHFLPTVVFFKGGFTGVDIFFVISGFVITHSLLVSKNEKRFSLLSFYKARIVRLFPSLIIVISAVILFYWLLLSREQYRSLVTAVLSAITYTSNLLYMHQVNYFDPEASTKPLLHLWSLGIEEQFYLIWPLIILVFRKRQKILPYVLLVLGVLSYGYYVFESLRSPTVAFYSPISRFWEIGAGCSVATLFMNRALKNDPKNTQKPSMSDNRLQAVAISFLVLFLSFPNFGSQTLGAILLLPIFLTALFIGISAKRDASGIGNNRFLLYFGRISYALYLWHWAILVLAKNTFGTNIPELLTCALICLSILLADLTTRFVERPLRENINRVRIAKYLFIGSVVLGLFSTVLSIIPSMHARNLLFRSSTLNGNIGFDEATTFVKSHHSACPQGEKGHPILSGIDLGTVTCFQSNPRRPADFIIVGDSHAGDLFVGFSSAYPKLNVVAILLYGSQGFLAANNPAFADALKYLETGPSKYILFSNMWSNPGVSLTDGRNSENFSQMISVLSKTRKNILLADDRPYFPFDPEGCKHVLLASRQRTCTGLTEYYNKSYNSYFPILEALSRKAPNIHLINFRSLFCSRKTCSMRVGSDLLFADRSHFNILGSNYVARELIKRNSILAID